MNAVTANRGPGRPPGQQHDATVHVRLPRPALEVLRRLARESKTTVAAIVRAGVLAALAKGIEPTVAIARDKAAPVRKRLDAWRVLRMVNLVVLRMGPLGLKLARAEAAAQTRRTG